MKYVMKVCFICFCGKADLITRFKVRVKSVFRASDCPVGA